MRSWILAFLVGSLAASAGPPAWGAAPLEVKMPPYTTFTLDNGLRVLLMEDHRLPLVVVDTWYGVGSYDDPPGASGFAHLFEHLMFMGTENVPQGQFDMLMEEAGGHNNATTGDDRTNYYDSGTSNTLDLLLYLEADRMQGLTITQEKLDLQRDVVRNERRQNYEDAPYGKIWLEIPAMMYPTSHPYHLAGIGTHEDLLNASLKHVTDFYESWYAPNNASLVVVGDFEPAATRALIETYFGGLQAAKLPEHTPPPEVKAPVTARKTVTDEVQLPAIVMAWHSPAYYAQGDADLDVLASILGAGADSRLVRRLVHEEGLAQEVEVFQASQQRSSLFVLTVIASPDADLAKLEGIIQEEIQAVAGAKPVSDDELKRVVAGLEMSFLTSLEPIFARAEKVQTYLHHVGRVDYLAEDLARYHAVTPASVGGVVGSWLSPDKAGVLYVVPEPAEAPTSETPAGEVKP